jgi:hypothetical protein
MGPEQADEVATGGLAALVNEVVHSVDDTPFASITPPPALSDPAPRAGG